MSLVSFLFFNIATKKFKITYTAHIIFLLVGAGLEADTHSHSLNYSTANMFIKCLLCVES